MKNIANKICVSITGWRESDWRGKLAEIKRFRITEAALFLEKYRRPQREKIYKALTNSIVKKVPLVHLRNDMSAEELEYLCNKYNNPYLTIHEDSFKGIAKWKKYKKKLYLEMNYDNKVPRNARVGQVGGFCVDLSHFMAAKEKRVKDFEYVIKRKKNNNIFACNHINGYSYKHKWDIHKIKNLEEFKYLKTLPRFVFGDVIAIETNNSIAEQLKFKKYIIKMLKK